MEFPPDTLLMDQLTFELKLPVPWTFAVHWLVWFTATVGAAQETLTEVIVGAGGWGGDGGVWEEPPLHPVNMDVRAVMRESATFAHARRLGMVRSLGIVWTVLQRRLGPRAASCAF